MAKGMTISVQGDAAMVRKLKLLGNRAPHVVEGALFEVVAKVESAAKALVPVDTGNLRASGFAATASMGKRGSGAVRNKAQVSAVVGFGGPAAPYALAVHENPRAGKTGGISPSGQLYRSWARTGQWKYLETPAKEMAPQLRPTIIRRIDREVAKLGATG